MEYIEMKTHEIDDLLARMSPELLMFYEVKNNLPGGKTLKQVNDTYKKNFKKIMNFVLVMSCWLFVTVVIIISIHFSNKENCRFGMILFIVWMVLTSIIIFFIKKRSDKIQKESFVLISILDKFRTTVEILDNPANRISDNHSVGSLKEALILQAYWVLDYEMKFDKVRMNKERQTRLIMQYGNVLEEYQKDLQSLLFVVEREFGLEFSKKEIFAEANKRFS
jgi:hypothetical protein